MSKQVHRRWRGGLSSGKSELGVRVVEDATEERWRIRLTLLLGIGLGLGLGVGWW